MADYIIVDYVALGGLADRSTETLEALENVAKPPGATLRYSPQTLDGIDDFQGEWDEKRGKLVDALAAVTQALTAISDSFEEVDDALAGALDGEAS